MIVMQDMQVVNPTATPRVVLLVQPVVAKQELATARQQRLEVVA